MPADLPPTPVLGADKEGRWAALVPKPLVTDLERSIASYGDLCGFRARFARPEDGFVDIEQGRAQIMFQDPDGDLLRFMLPLGTRPAQSGA